MNELIAPLFLEDGPGSTNWIVLIGGFALIWVFLVILPARKEKKKKEEMLATLSKGDRVLVQAGFFGKVTQTKDEIVVLDCGGAKIEVLRSTIVKVVSGKGGKAEKSDKTKEASAS